MTWIIGIAAFVVGGISGMVLMGAVCASDPPDLDDDDEGAYDEAEWYR